MCWGSKERNSVEISIPARVSQHHSSPGPASASTATLRVSSLRLPGPQTPAPPLATSQIPISIPLVRVNPRLASEQSFGLKVLVYGTDPVVDLVAVHGLDGHRESTWTAENGILWLRDCLPGIVPNVRILTYGYDGRTHDSTPLSCQTLHDHSIDLITSLNLHRHDTNTNERPIIFIAHSIGGIIVKDALIHSNSANERNLKHHSAIKTSTYGILFFGTPHQGTDNLTWKRILSFFANTNHAILRDLEEGSGALQKQLGQYNHISRDFDTKFFYEIYPPSSGRDIIVPKSSAVVPGATDTEVFAIHSDHERLVKYESADDGGFRKVSSCIRLMVEEAPIKISENWQRWKRIKAAESNDMPITFKIPFELQYRRNIHFTGREYLLDALRGKIKDNRSIPVILHGTGGIGKTEIALEYAYTNQTKYRSIFWINAATKEATLLGFREVAQRIIKQHAKITHQMKPDYLQIAKILDMVDVVDENGRISHEREHTERMVQGLKLWFTNEENRDWLLIFDNVDDLENSNIQAFIPSASHGTIIMTSRRPECAGFGVGLEVAEMLEQEGIVLFLRSARREINPPSLEDYPMAAKVVKKLGYLPLGIVQAGAYVAARQISLQKYLDIYEIFFNKVFGEKPPSAVWSYGDRTALTTWEISFQAIKEENEEAAELLSLCSFFSNDDIREDMLCRGKRLDEDDVTITNSLILLFSYSLAQRKGSDDTFYIHPLVHLWARERLEEYELVQKASEAAKIVGFVVNHSGNHSGSGSVLDFEYQDKVMAHVNVVSVNIEKYLKAEWTETLLINSIGSVATMLNGRGRWEESERLRLRVVEASQRVVGNEHPHTLIAMSNLASTYGEQGRWKEAEEIECQIIESTQRVLGEVHPHTLTYMANLGVTYLHQGRWKEAERLESKVMGAREIALGKEHPGTLSAMDNLAVAYMEQGRWEEAEELQLHTTEVKQKVMGNEHPETLTAIANLASTYANQGRWKKAEVLELQVMKASQKVLGKMHPQTLHAMANLAVTYANQGRLEEAEELDLQVMEETQRVLGKMHPQTINAMANLAGTYSRQERWKEAEELQLQAVEARQRVLGNEHPQTLVGMRNLAATYFKRRRLDEAERIQLQVIEMMQRLLGEEHPDTLMAMTNLVATYLGQERLKEGKDLEVQVAELRQRAERKAHPKVVPVKTLTGTLWKEAEELQLQVMKTRQDALGIGHPDTLMIMASLATIYSRQGQWKEANELELQIKEARQRTTVNEHPEALSESAAVSISPTYSGQGLWEKAEERQLQLLEAKKSTLGIENPQTLIMMASLAATYLSQGRWEEGKDMQLQVMKSMQRVLGEVHPHTLMITADLASTYWKQGKWKEAEELQLQVMEVRQRVLGKEHRDTLKAMANLAVTYFCQNRFEDAEELELKLLEIKSKALEQW